MYDVTVTKLSVSGFLVTKIFIILTAVHEVREWHKNILLFFLTHCIDQYEQVTSPQTRLLELIIPMVIQFYEFTVGLNQNLLRFELNHQNWQWVLGTVFELYFFLWLE